MKGPIMARRVGSWWIKDGIDGRRIEAQGFASLVGSIPGFAWTEDHGDAGVVAKDFVETAKYIEQVDEVVFGNGVTLTVEQEAIADQITNKHVRHLRSLHRHIHAIHNRLIALEADKLAELEKLLTKDQLKQLRDERQSGGDDHRVSSTGSKANGE